MPRINVSMPEFTDKFISMFWSRVLIKEDNECWEWQHQRLTKEYGSTVFRQRRYLAHRVSYFLGNNRNLPTELCVLHKCDNPPCCNPNHLFLGTKADNLADMYKKGRQAKGDKHFSHKHPELLPRGERHVHSKLTAEIVIEIKQAMPLKRKTVFALASKHNVSYHCIYNVVYGHTWKHITI